MNDCKHELARRTRVIPTRAGVVTEQFLLCYYCSEEFDIDEEAK